MWEGLVGPQCSLCCINAVEQVRNPATGAVYILLESQLDKIPGAVPKAKKCKGKAKDEAPEKGFEVCAGAVSLELPPHSSGNPRHQHLR